MLAVTRYGFKARDIAALFKKHGNSLTRWRGQGLCMEGSDPDFKRQCFENQPYP